MYGRDEKMEMLRNEDEGASTTAAIAMAEKGGKESDAG
jgi:hypothetical protein